jgi:hypothetical protein
MLIILSFSLSGYGLAYAKTSQEISPFLFVPQRREEPIAAIGRNQNSRFAAGSYRIAANGIL